MDAIIFLQYFFFLLYSSSPRLLYVAVNLYLNDFSFALGIINYQCQAFNEATQRDYNVSAFTLWNVE